MSLTAARMAETLTSTVLKVIVSGEPRPVRGVEILEPGATTSIEPGDLVLGIGTRDAAEALALVERTHAAAGLVLHTNLATDVAEVCRARGLPLLALSDHTTWSMAAQLLREATEASLAPVGDDIDPHELFSLADTLSELLDAPITIEDTGSRVLAWSAAQPGVDGARTATIMARRVPSQLRDSFRARGIFRQLARSSEPLLVAGDAQTKPRWILPIRAGGEWLGSVWAVLEGSQTPARAEEAKLLTDVLALHLIRLRARSDLDRHLELEQVRRVLAGQPSTLLAGRSTNSWSVALLSGPTTVEDSAMPAALRQQVWAATLRRHGWGRPMLADVDDQVIGLVASEGTAPGTAQWLRVVVERDHEQHPTMWATVNACTGLEDVPMAVRRVREQAGARGTDSRPFTTAADCWHQVCLQRSQSIRTDDLASPIPLLAEHPGDGELLVATLTSVLRFWGNPQAAAERLGVHPNTVRNRLIRIQTLVPLDLHDPEQRLALWLECERLTPR